MGRQVQQRPFRIGVFFNRQTKASREQVIGIFNFAGLHPDWELHLFTRPESADELARHGRTADVYRERLPSAAWHFEDDARFTRWLQALPKPCALLVHSDTLALSVYAACRRAKIAIPAQLAVTGIGNEEGVCESATPPLSSVEPDYRLAGSRAAEILDGLLRGHRRGGICERYGILRLEERMSSRKVSGSRHLAQQAHEAIRTRAFTPLRVADLAKEAGVSLRTLEKAYADVYGVSLREDLLRQRLAEAKRLLGFSSTPIGELHAKCGFRTASALKAAFVRRFAVSPRAFRNRPA